MASAAEGCKCNGWKAKAGKVICDHGLNNTKIKCYDLRFSKKHYDSLDKLAEDFDDILSSCVSTIIQKYIDSIDYTMMHFYERPQISLTMFIGEAANKVIIQHYEFMDPYTLLDVMEFTPHLNLADRTGDPTAFLEEVLAKGLHFRFRYMDNAV